MSDNQSNNKRIFNLYQGLNLAQFPIYEQSISKILGYRYFFMGIAMILVVLYHCYCSANDIWLLSFFRKGYIGVDIFFFFSGLGLSFSYEKNSLTKFYKNRILRILPLYWVWALVHTIVISLRTHTVPSFIDVIGLTTSASYYGFGNIRSNWYLSATICFYLFFPVLFYLVRKFKWIVLSSILVSTAVLLYYFHINWYHDAFIGRLYIFMLGIFTHCIIANKRFTISDIFKLSIISLLGLYSLNFNDFQYWGASCLCPLLLAFLIFTPPSIMKSQIISICGKYSLEIFIGNCWTMLLMDVCNCAITYKIVIYFMSNIVFAVILVIVNRLFKTIH